MFEESKFEGIRVKLGVKNYFQRQEFRKNLKLTLALM